MIEKGIKIKLVGEFIRSRRESLKLSQRALGQLFDPAVTTQFISNVERGVTPLPPNHIPILAKALMVSESELMSLLEKEFAMKLSGKLGKVDSVSVSDDGETVSLIVEAKDCDLLRGIYDAYRMADAQTRQAFVTVCESILKVQGSR